MAAILFFPTDRSQHRSYCMIDGCSVWNKNEWAANILCPAPPDLFILLKSMPDMQLRENPGHHGICDAHRVKFDRARRDNNLDTTCANRACMFSQRTFSATGGWKLVKKHDTTKRGRGPKFKECKALEYFPSLDVERAAVHLCEYCAGAYTLREQMDASGIMGDLDNCGEAESSAAAAAAGSSAKASPFVLFLCVD
jgi:hypothetical protein